MWKSKKFVVAALLAAVLLVGSIGGVVLANEDEDGNQQEAVRGALLDRVCKIYEENTGMAIDCDELKDAIAQALSERRDEALDSYLQKLVGKGRITQEEAGEIEEWWKQKPEALGPNLFPRAFAFGAPRVRHILGGGRGWHCPKLPGLAD